jgi:hypothetical protein
LEFIKIWWHTRAKKNRILWKCIHIQWLYYNVWISLKKISNIKLVEDKDTAETAPGIQEKQLRDSNCYM